MEYRLNPGNTCFGTSLANYFIYIGEQSIARHICKNYRFGPLVKSNGAIVPGLTTRITRDLTEEKYTATLFIKILLPILNRN